MGNSVGNVVGNAAGNAVEILWEMAGGMMQFFHLTRG